MKQPLEIAGYMCIYPRLLSDSSKDVESPVGVENGECCRGLKICFCPPTQTPMLSATENQHGMLELDFASVCQIYRLC